MTETSAEVAKYEAATRAGLSGDEAAEFATLLHGETPDEVHAYADRLVNFVNGLSGEYVKPDRATDHSQGHGKPGDVGSTPQDDFRFKMIEVFRR